MSKTKTVLLASHIPSVDKIWIGKEILDSVRQNLPNAEIVVGINPSSCIHDWIDVVKQYTDHIEITPKNLVVNSDCSSYQSALRKYKELGLKSDLIWFLHTQGTRSSRHEDRQEHLRCLLGAQENICKIMESNPKIGSFGRVLTPLPHINANIKLEEDDFLSDYYDFPYSNIRFFYIGAMFVLKGDVLNKFVYNCNDKFFNKLLSSKRPGDRWFMERDFPEIVPRLGYNYEMYSIDNNYNIPIHGINLNDFYEHHLKLWEQKNKVEYSGLYSASTTLI